MSVAALTTHFGATQQRSWLLAMSRVGKGVPPALRLHNELRAAFPPSSVPSEQWQGLQIFAP
jgi:hypothetical protein